MFNLKPLLAALALTLPVHSFEAEPKTDLPAAAIAIDKTLKAYHYNPATLEQPAYKSIARQAQELAKNSPDTRAFIEGYNSLWDKGPFSHVRLGMAHGTADQLAEYLDNMDVGDGGATLSWRDDIAVLTINTMMGRDTIRRIDEAYEDIKSRSPRGLIIDLRSNEGGAFAIRPMIEHIISEPMDAGGFVAQKWNQTHDTPPTAADLKTIAPWNGWSVRAFWDDIQSSALIKVHLTPRATTYDGPVFVLTSSRTASAAELAVDALKGAKRITLAGEKTAGEMLSQKPYEIDGGFHLFLPIADYYSATSGRIEGAGVTPDIELPASDAMEYALNALRGR